MFAFPSYKSASGEGLASYIYIFFKFLDAGNTSLSDRPDELANLCNRYALAFIV